MQTSLRAPALESAVRCRIATSASLRASAEEIAQWRRQPIDAGVHLPASFLKHAEDQTVLALHAVLGAIAKECWQHRLFADWGVVAAPNFFGRISIAQTMERFRKEGAWGISPHLIPHQSLHAVSGTISQALSIHGPNFGIGGGPNAGADAFLLAVALLADSGLPGLWLVLTGYETEWIPAVDRAVPAPPCLGVALALTPVIDIANDGHSPSGPHMHNPGGRGSCRAVGTSSILSAHGSAGASPSRPASTNLSLSIRHARPSVSPSALYPDFQLGSFAEELATGAGQWRLSDSHWLELDAEARA